MLLGNIPAEDLRTLRVTLEVTYDTTTLTLNDVLDAALAGFEHEWAEAILVDFDRVR